MSGETRSEGQPHDRLTRLCDAMTVTLEAHPEYQEGDKCIIFMDSKVKGGLVMFGYEDDTEALAAIFAHLRAIFRSNGQDMMLAPLRGTPRNQ